MRTETANGCCSTFHYFYNVRTADQPIISPTLRIFGWSIVAAALVVLLRRIRLMELDSFEFDDAFMFLRYAEHLIDGNGYTWNAGDAPIFGCTSILYTWVIAAVRFFFREARSSLVLILPAAAFGLAFLAVMQAGLHTRMKNEVLRDRLVIALCTVPWLVFPLIFGFHISTGMETTLSLFLHAVFLFAVLRYSEGAERSWSALAAAVASAGLLYLARPDNALAAALFPAFWLAGKKQYRHLAFFAAGLALWIGVDSVVRMSVFGGVLPLSYYAKRSGFTEGYTARYFWNPVKYLTLFASYTLPFLLVIIAFFRSRHWKVLLPFLIPVVLTFLYFFTFDQIMGFDARLYFPFTPYLVLPAFLIADDVLMRGPEDRRALISPSTLVRKAGFLLIFLFFSTWSKYRFINMYERWAMEQGVQDAIEVPGLEARKYNREQSIRHISAWMSELPDDLVIAATEHGYLGGEHPDQRIFDLSGLQNPVIARAGYSDELLETEAPDFIWMPHQDLTVLHYEVRTGEYFRTRYEYIPNVYAFGCAVRKDSKYYDALKECIR